MDGTNVPFYKQEFYGIMSISLLNRVLAEAQGLRHNGLDSSEQSMRRST